MRILFLSNFYPPYERGGYEQLCQEVANGLKDRGHTIVVLTSNYGVNGPPLVEQAVHRILKTEIELQPYRGTLDFFFNRKRRLQEIRSRFREVVINFQPDILFVWGMWNLPRELLVLAESWPSLKVVYYLADYWPTLPDVYTLHWREPSRRWYTSFPKQILGQIASALQGRRSDIPDLKFEHTLCVSQAVRQRLLDAGLPLAHAQVVYNGIDLVPFLAARELREQRQETKSLSLLYAGRLSPDKGVHTAIEAVAELARRGYLVTLTLVGGGSPEYEMTLRSLCQRLRISDQVIFQGSVPRNQMPQVMAQFDVLMFTSTWPEPLARIVQEAMAAGLVVVGTNVGGMPEILMNDVNGLTFAPENARGLAMQIEKLILDPSLYNQFAEAELRVVREKFDINRMFAEIEAYLHSVVNGQK